MPAMTWSKVSSTSPANIVVDDGTVALTRADTRNYESFKEILGWLETVGWVLEERSTNGPDEEFNAFRISKDVITYEGFVQTHNFIYTMRVSTDSNGNWVRTFNIHNGLNTTLETVSTTTSYFNSNSSLITLTTLPGTGAQFYTSDQDPSSFILLWKYDSGRYTCRGFYPGDGALRASKPTSDPAKPNHYYSMVPLFYDIPLWNTTTGANPIWASYDISSSNAGPSQPVITHGMLEFSSSGRSIARWFQPDVSTLEVPGETIQQCDFRYTARITTVEVDAKYYLKFGIIGNGAFALFDFGTTNPKFNT